MYTLEELEDIISIVNEKIILANRMGELNQLLEQWGIELPWESEPVYKTRRDGKIVVLGESRVNVSGLIGIVKSLNLDKDRFEFCTEYDKAKNYQYNKLRYNENYRVVMFGPVPHSSTGKNDSSSVIAELQNSEGYPKVVCLGENELKITKSSFKKALEELIESGFI